MWKKEWNKAESETARERLNDIDMEDYKISGKYGDVSPTSFSSKDQARLRHLNQEREFWKKKL